MGGRWEGWGLQDNYGELKDRSVTSPALSLGAGIETSTHGNSAWQAGASASVEGVAGMGSHGMSALELKAGGRVGYAGVADVEANVTSSVGSPTASISVGRRSTGVSSATRWQCTSTCSSAWAFRFSPT
jgi:hypothetical protein